MVGNYAVRQNGTIVLLNAKVPTTWEQWVLFTGDRHHDSIHCARELELRHLKEAKDRGALIIDVGDMFDAMQGQYDPRRSYAELRPEYKSDDYFDEIVKDAAQFYAPFAENFLVIGLGNHTTAVLRKSNINLVDRLVAQLNLTTGSNVLSGAYGGWVRFLCEISHIRTSLTIRYFHGATAGGPVTKGILDVDRQAAYLPDADVVCNGHTHTAYWTSVMRQLLNHNGNEEMRVSHFIRTPGYTRPMGARTGFYAERNPTPKPVGAIWMRVFYAGERLHAEFTPSIE